MYFIVYQLKFVILPVIKCFDLSFDQVICQGQKMSSASMRTKSMAKKLFIGNLSFNMTDDQLTQVFSTYGKVVSANIVFDKFSNRSKGFAFVEFETEEEAQAAMQALDGSEQDGRNIAVKEALPRPDRPQM